MFTEKEIAYIKSQRLGRLATVSADGQPDAVSIAYEFDGAQFFIGGFNTRGTRRHKNLQAGNAKVALIIDDLETIDPWAPRGIRIYGRAEIVEREGPFGTGVYHRVIPETSWSWSVEKPGMVDGVFSPHKTLHQ